MQSIKLSAFLLFCLFYTATGVQIVWDNSVAPNFNLFEGNNIEEFVGRMGEIRVPNQFFIYPGTKWCGAGNIAENDNDFGTEIETDKCCFAHDHCSDTIGGFQTKHGLTNPNFYTRLNCDCDNQFYDCLKSNNNMVSDQLGHIYFTALGTKCFSYQYPISGCSKYTFFPTMKCVSYQVDETKEKEYQWFDIPNF
ncbi:phospholipase A2-like [Diabrotica undecimpunctata]|uniref:phospholipase A2-like n=1 Tax=Diabrotica undecimpunctata TaxID=50387 RepID=UPI003B636004